MTTKSRFDADLQFSTEQNSALRQFYFRSFPTLKRIEVVDRYDLQQKGIDTILHLACGKRILVDEKIRRQDYGDILLEEYSDFDNKKPGWLMKDAYTDYVLYMFTDTGRACLFPFQLLKAAWLRYSQMWIEAYGRLFAKNEDYRTSNVPVPTEVLLNSVKNEMENLDGLRTEFRQDENQREMF